MMAACGVTEPAIAQLLGLTIADMDERFTDQLRFGNSISASHLLTGVNAKAAGGNVSAIVWLLERLDLALGRERRG
jgi:hypothetical protein